MQFVTTIHKKYSDNSANINKKKLSIFMLPISFFSSFKVNSISMYRNYWSILVRANYYFPKCLKWESQLVTHSTTNRKSSPFWWLTKSHRKISLGFFNTLIIKTKYILFKNSLLYILSLLMQTPHTYLPFSYKIYMDSLVCYIFIQALSEM